MIYKLKALAYFLILFFLGCSQITTIKVDFKKPDIKKYLSSHFMGQLGTLPVGFEIYSVSLRVDTVFISGSVFDEQTKETFPINLWVGKFLNRKSTTGYEYIEPEKRKYLMKTETDGIFFVNFKIHKDDVLFGDEIGYHPGIFRIYDIYETQVY